MHESKLIQDKRNIEFQAFRSGDAADTKDVYARLVIVNICGVALWLATNQVGTLVWCLGFSALIYVYVFRFLRRHTGDASRRDVIICVCSSIFIAFWYSAMVVYIATLRDGEFVLLASCGVLGMALHCLSRNVEFNYGAYIDFVFVIGSGLGVTLVAALHSSTLGAGLATIIGGLCASAYFWLSFQQLIAVNKALAKETREKIQNQKMLALGQLASGVAHDFNNLLTVISGNIELAMLDTKDPENKELLDEAKSSSKRGAELVRQLLVYGKQSELRISKVELGTVFERLTQLLNRTLPAHIQLDFKETPLGADFYTDNALLESALLNLIINARKAIGDAAGTISLSAQPDPSGKFVEIRVTDTGPGMTDEVRARAEEPFFTTRPVGEGSGLGLSMVNGYAVQSGGSLDFHNVKGGGFCAVVTLPLKDAAFSATSL